MIEFHVGIRHTLEADLANVVVPPDNSKHDVTRNCSTFPAALFRFSGTALNKKDGASVTPYLAAHLFRWIPSNLLGHPGLAGMYAFYCLPHFFFCQRRPICELAQGVLVVDLDLSRCAHRAGPGNSSTNSP